LLLPQRSPHARLFFFFSCCAVEFDGSTGFAPQVMLLKN